jgi:hypothetical protein
MSMYGRSLNFAGIASGPRLAATKIKVYLALPELQQREIPADLQGGRRGARHRYPFRGQHPAGMQSAVWKSEWIIHSGLAQVRPVRSPSQTYHWLALRPLPTVMSAILASADAAGAERMRLVKMWRAGRSPFVASIGISRATRFCWPAQVGAIAKQGFAPIFDFKMGKRPPWRGANWEESTDAMLVADARRPRPSDERAVLVFGRSHQRSRECWWGSTCRRPRKTRRPATSWPA